MRSTASSVEPPWFRRRGYAHFDEPLGFDAAQRLVENPAAIVRHGFYPFIRIVKTEKRYAKTETGERRVREKERGIAYAAHRDAAIYSYYNYLLAPFYERELGSCGVSPVVLAYRKFPTPRSNIDFALEVFKHISTLGDCVVVALDVEKFFDTIPHGSIKRHWKRLLRCDTLPDDHYVVFRALTKWGFIDLEALRRRLGISRRALKQWPRGRRLCSSSVFREIAGDLVQPGTPIDSPCGIPQGSPMSGLLSNIAMLGVDAAVHAAASANSVLYRRYSDDIVLVGESSAVARVLETLKAELAGMGLLVNEAKTIEAQFGRDSSGNLSVNGAPLQYLGFLFDGERYLLRSQTVGRSVRRMKQAVRKAKRSAQSRVEEGQPLKIYRRSLFEQHSHLGPLGTRGSRGSGLWGYAKRAAETMESIHIRKQAGRHWRRINDAIKEAEEEG